MGNDTRRRAVPERQAALEGKADVDAGSATTVGIRALARNVSGVVTEVAETGRPTIVTKHGVPVAAVVPIRGTWVSRLL